mmetsp:Transcript_25341/g.52049  ORF Transcript_25341/g.52049 Transcript_25341/m.52049 type:complete len:99 (+) Transcript_25341:79-375(+)
MATDRYVALLAESEGLSAEEEKIEGGTKKPPKASFAISVINLSAAVLGAGMLGLPYGFAEAGWLLGLIMLSGSGVLSAFTMHLLSVVACDVGKATGNM